jgi:hypothetical protein
LLVALALDRVIGQDSPIFSILGRDPLKRDCLSGFRVGKKRGKVMSPKNQIFAYERKTRRWLTEALPSTWDHRPIGELVSSLSGGEKTGKLWRVAQT